MQTVFSRTTKWPGSSCSWAKPIARSATTVRCSRTTSFTTPAYRDVRSCQFDDGRLTGAAALLADEFNCRSRWSDARNHCAELEFLVINDHAQEGAYKVPSLRNVALRAPYMDAGQFATLADVLRHYNRAPAASQGHTELESLRLKPSELSQLEAFLHALTGTLTVNGEPLRSGRP